MKFTPKLLIPAATALLCASSAFAGSVSFTSTTLGEPTYNRLCVGNSLCGTTIDPVLGVPVDVSTRGTAVHYLATMLTVSVSGLYTFVSTTPLVTPGGTEHTWDNYTFVYRDSFSPAAPLQNLVNGNDDYLSTGGLSGFDANLIAGLSYIFVNTGWRNSDFGDFTAVISGPGDITFMSVSAVPEPGTNAMMLLGLGVMGGVSRRRAGNKHAKPALQAAEPAAA
ncbi:MAG: hypothetical protein RLZZ584_1690 [Pseudomonadota bacterium]|jgi:hypothetical protein